MSPVEERLPCPVRGCPASRTPEHAFCWQHWKSVPAELRREVIRTWNARRRARHRLEVARSAGAPAERLDAIGTAQLKLVEGEAAAALREHLQALENAQAAIETRRPIDLFALAR